MKKIMVGLVSVLVLVTLIVACAAPAPAPVPTPTPTPTPTPAPTPEVEKHVWIIQTMQPSGTSVWDVELAFCDSITEDSGGRITCKLHSGGELVPAGDELDAVVAGTLSAGINAPVYDEGKIGKSGSVFTGVLPAGLNCHQLINWMEAGGGLELLQEAYDAAGYDVVRTFPHQVAGAECFGYFNKEIHSTADFAGLKFRTAGIWGSIMSEYFGASVTLLPGVEVYQAAERGVIDAFELAMPSVNWPLGFHEIMKYLYTEGIHAPAADDCMAINRDAWEALSPDLQALVWDLARASATHALAYNLQADAEGLDNLLEYAKTHDFEVKHLPLDVQKEIFDKANEFYDEYMASGKDPMFNKALTSMREFKTAQAKLADYMFPKY